MEALGGVVRTDFGDFRRIFESVCISRLFNTCKKLVELFSGCNLESQKVKRSQWQRSEAGQSLRHPSAPMLHFSREDGGRRALEIEDSNGVAHENASIAHYIALLFLLAFQPVTWAPEIDRAAAMRCRLLLCLRSPRSKKRA